jgi:hypothetical protein
VIITAAIGGAGKNAWCREHGVYPAELDKWRGSCASAPADPEGARAASPRRHCHRPSDTRPSHFTLFHSLSTKTLSRQLPLPSMLWRAPTRCSSTANSALLNWLPWSVLTISGAPQRAAACPDLVGASQRVREHSLTHEGFE